MHLSPIYCKKVNNQYKSTKLMPNFDTKDHCVGTQLSLFVTIDATKWYFVPKVTNKEH